MPMPAPDIFVIVAPIVLSIVGVGVALAALMLRVTARLDNAIAEAGADRRAADAKMDEWRRESNAKMDEWRRESNAKMDEWRRHSDAKMEEFRKRMDEHRDISEAKMDEWRRDSDAKMGEFRGRMDEFRGHMQRLGERQAHLEGYRDGSAGPSPAPAE